MVIVASVLAAGLVAVLWSLVRLCRRGSLPCRAKRRQRPQHRYAPLQDPNAIRMSAQGSISHTLMPIRARSVENCSSYVFDWKWAPLPCSRSAPKLSSLVFRVNMIK